MRITVKVLFAPLPGTCYHSTAQAAHLHSHLRLIPAALVPRPWDFAPAPVAADPPAPSEDPSQQPDNEEPNTTPESPSDDQPSSRPASPPTLLPPLSIHEPAFGEPEPDTATPVDNTPAPPAMESAVAAALEEEKDTEKQVEASEGGELPSVSVVPPTPTSAITTTSIETATAV